MELEELQPEMELSFVDEAETRLRIYLSPEYYLEWQAFVYSPSELEAVVHGAGALKKAEEVAVCCTGPVVSVETGKEGEECRG